MTTPADLPADGRRVVDVTDRLTPGAKALARQRAAQNSDPLVDAFVRAHSLAPLVEDPPPAQFVVARLRDALDAANGVPRPTYAEGFNTLVQQVTAEARRAEDDRLRAAFDAGRAYERGAAIRRRVGKSLAARRTAVQEAAREYLDERTPDAARLATFVLAGFTGTPLEQVA